MSVATSVVITGGAGGIGAAAARTLAASGMQVILAVRDPARCEPLLAELERDHLNVRALRCDVSQPGDVEELLERVTAECERIGVLINNAGTMYPIGNIDDVDAQAWLGNIAVNLGGAYLCSRAVLPHFRRAGCGTIINLSSGAAFHSLPGWSAYCCGKAGLAMLTRCLAAEVDGTNIRVYGLQPGMVRTESVRAALKHKVNRVAALDPETFSDPMETARAILWLCREAPADLSGEEVVMTDPAIRTRIESEDAHTGLV